MKYVVRVAALALMPVAFGSALALADTSSPASASTHHQTAWSKVIHHCHHIGCSSHLSHAIREDLGIGNKPVRVHWGDTTTIWVKMPHNEAQTFTS